MTGKNTRIIILPCIDSPDIAASRRKELDIARSAAAALGRSAVEAARNGYYLNRAGEKVDWRLLVQGACAAKRSIAPEDRLPVAKLRSEPETRVQVANETTLQASRRLVEAGLRPLALNFANGVHPEEAFSTVRGLKKRCCAGPAPFISRSLTIQCTSATHSGRGQILLIGQSTRPMFLSFGRTTERSSTGRGC